MTIKSLTMLSLLPEIYHKNLVLLINAFHISSYMSTTLSVTIDEDVNVQIFL